MSAQSTVWKTESSLTSQNLAMILTLAAGTALAIGFRQFEGPGFSGSRAGFLLGILMICIGVGMFLFGGRQVVAVEPRFRRIVVTRFTSLRESSKEIRFDEISEVYVGESGDQEGGSIRYHVVAKLTTGKEIALFMGFFEGARSESAMEARCQRLLECMRIAG